MLCASGCLPRSATRPVAPRSLVCLSMRSLPVGPPAGPLKGTSAQANASTTPSAWTLRALGRSVHAVTSHFVAASDNSTPVMPPASETSRLSTNCSRIRVIFRAPSALRRAISFCRAADRATIRLATLRQPISSMQVTAHSRMINGFFTSCARSWMRVRDATSSATGAFRFCKCSRVLHRLHLAQGVCQADVRLQPGYHAAKVKVMMLAELPVATPTHTEPIPGPSHQDR